FQVVVDLVHAGIDQRFAVAVVQDTERYGDVHLGQVGADRARRLAYALEQGMRWSAYRDDDAELGRAPFARFACGSEKFVRFAQRFGDHIGSVTRALRAEVTVFRTATLFGVE